MVLITHDMDEALALAHRIIVLDGPLGRVIGDFSPDLPRPADRIPRHSSTGNAA
jgi:NitT/TauT family transport system ATP-binding protein